MAFAIEFVADWIVLMDSTEKGRPGLVMLRRGARRRAALRPRVHEGLFGPVEVADLHFEGGGTAWCVPFACFAFDEN